MNAIILWAAFACLLCVGPTYAQTSRVSQGSREGQANLARLKQAILHNQVTRCEVFCLPATIEAAGALNPGDVAHFYKYKLEVHLLSSRSKLMISLCRAIEETKVRPTDHYLGDLRWGCRLTDSKEKLVYSIFVDDREKVAVVDGKRMYFQGGIDAWFESNFSDYFDSLTNK